MKQKKQKNTPQTFTDDMLRRIVGKHAGTISRWINNEIQASVTRTQPSPVFSSEKCLRLFSLLRQADILDENNLPARLSTAQKGILANELTRILDISHQWREFSKLWHINPETLRSGYAKGMKQPNIGLFIDKIKQLLG